MRVRVLPLVVIALVLGLAQPATAGIDPEATFRTERVYFHCVGPVKLQHAYNVQNQYPTWDTTPPAGSVQGGEGCGRPEYGLTNGDDRRNPHDTVFRGTFTGNLNAFNVELHDLASVFGNTMGEIPMIVTLYVDGSPILDSGVISVPAEASETGASHVARFSIDNLRLADEVGDGEIERTLELVVRSTLDSAHAWVWDTTEVPAGITFNPEKLEPVRVRA
jgi:hypothetical protein